MRGSRKRPWRAAAMFWLGGLALGQASQDCATQPATLKAMRDCYRPLLVFAPSSKNPSLLEQQALLEQYADDMMDRNLLFVPVLARASGFTKPLDAPYVLPSEAEMGAIRKRFKVDMAEFTVVLVGKDGEEKYRFRKPVSVLKLDELVDAMPMGQAEKSARAARAK